MQAFLEPLKELADYQEIVSSRKKKTGFQQIAGVFIGIGQIITFG